MQTSFTDMQAFKRCRQMWAFGKEYKPRRISSAFWLGSFVHQALAHYYEHGDIELPSAIAKWVTSTSHQIADDVTLEELIELGTVMVKHYVEWAKSADLMDKMHVHKVEVPFSLKLHDAVTIEGRFDGLMTYGRKKDEWWIHEIKTAAQISEEWLTLSEQAALYTWALSMGLKKGKVMGVVYTILKKYKPNEPVEKNGVLTLRKGAATDVITIEKAERLTGLKLDSEVKDGYRMAENIGGNPFVKRVRVALNSNQLRTFIKNMVAVVDDMNSAVIYPNANEMNCSMCPFMQPCIAKQREDNYKSILEASYDHR